MVDYSKVDEARSYICSKLPAGFECNVGLVLGTAMASAVSQMQVVAEISYKDVPNMKPSTNPVHPGKFVFGVLGGKNVCCMQGRVHLYEGYSADDVVFGIFVMKLLGVRELIITNAAGAINVGYEVGDFVLIADHINFTGKNPLSLHIDSRLGTPCPDMTYTYSPRLRKLVRDAAEMRADSLAEGVYLGLMGPSFETPAEIRAFRNMGADLVGMSTVLEVIAAAACGMEVLGISLITNMAAGVTDEKLSANDVSHFGKDVSDKLEAIIASAVV